MAAVRVADARRSETARRRRQGTAKALAALQHEVDLRGEVTAGELEVRTKKKEPWWDWTPTKSRLEYLVATGAISTGRKPNFERTYMSLFEACPITWSRRVTPSTPTPPAAASVMLAARGARRRRQKDITFYMWMQAASARKVIKELVADGELLEVEIEGLKGPFYMHPKAARPRTVNAAALVNPFDPMMWRRDRISDLFGFDYVLEIFVPEAKRVFGYYVLPFLLGDEFVARVDLKADRKAERAARAGEHAEFGVDLDEVGRRSPTNCAKWRAGEARLDRREEEGRFRRAVGQSGGVIDPRGSNCPAECGGATPPSSNFETSVGTLVWVDEPGDVFERDGEAARAGRGSTPPTTVSAARVKWDIARRC